MGIPWEGCSLFPHSPGVPGPGFPHRAAPAGFPSWDFPTETEQPGMLQGQVTFAHPSMTGVVVMMRSASSRCCCPVLGSASASTSTSTHTLLPGIFSRWVLLGTRGDLPPPCEHMHWDGCPAFLRPLPPSMNNQERSVTPPWVPCARLAVPGLHGHSLPQPSPGGCVMPRPLLRAAVTLPTRVMKPRFFLVGKSASPIPALAYPAPASIGTPSSALAPSASPAPPIPWPRSPWPRNTWAVPACNGCELSFPACVQ